MKKCDCKDFKKFVVKENRMKNAQKWNYCIFCGKKMKEEEKK